MIVASQDTLRIRSLFTGLFVNLLEQGSAEVIFTRKSEALQALKRYNNVRLDGKPMKIEVIGADVGLSAASATRASVVPAARGRGQREVVMMYAHFCKFMAYVMPWLVNLPLIWDKYNFPPLLTFVFIIFHFRPARGGVGVDRGGAGTSSLPPG